MSRESEVLQLRQDVAALQHRVTVLEETLARFFAAMEQDGSHSHLARLAMMKTREQDEQPRQYSATAEYYLSSLLALSNNHM